MKKKKRLKTGNLLIMSAAAAALVFSLWLFPGKGSPQEMPEAATETAVPSQSANAAAETAEPQPSADIQEPLTAESYFHVPVKTESYAKAGSLQEKYVYEAGPQGIYTIRNTELRRDCTYKISFASSADGTAILNIRVCSSRTGEVYFETDTETASGTSVTEKEFTVSDDCADAEAEIRNMSDSVSVILTNPCISAELPEILVRVSQAGYLAGDEKRCTFAEDPGDFFDAVNAETGQTVYTGTIAQRGFNPDTGEYNSYGEFTSVTQPGTYYIRTQNGHESYLFEIAEDPFADLTAALLHEFVYQRCGCDLSESAAGSYAHPACHSDEAVLYNTDRRYDVSGGWHDAADYGRYMKTGTKAVNDLLFAYMRAPYLFTDNDSEPNTGNGIPDILDEARYELEWMLKMQEDSGAVHIKVVTRRFPKMYYMPNDFWSGLTLMATETISTADFGGTMAAASIAFRPVDEAFADECLNAAVRAEQYLSAHPGMTAVYNPAGFDCGQYLDESDQDGRFYTETALYAATMDRNYLYKAESIYNGNPHAADGTGWKDNGFYGSWLFLTSGDAADAEPWLYESLVSRLLSAADTYLYYAQSTAYNVAVNTYKWGCSGTVCDRSIQLCMAYDLTGRQEYRQAAVEQLSWILGRNALNKSLVTGFGTDYPHDIHCRLTYNTAVELRGTLVAGPDAYYEDPVISAVPYGTPAAKVYFDNSGSYSTNEFAIYYNSALISLLSFLRA